MSSTSPKGRPIRQKQSVHSKKKLVKRKKKKNKKGLSKKDRRRALFKGWGECALKRLTETGKNIISIGYVEFNQLPLSDKITNNTFSIAIFQKLATKSYFFHILSKKCHHIGSTKSIVSWHIATYVS